METGISFLSDVPKVASARACTGKEFLPCALRQSTPILPIGRTSYPPAGAVAHTSHTCSHLLPFLPSPSCAARRAPPGAQQPRQQPPNRHPHRHADRVHGQWFRRQRRTGQPPPRRHQPLHRRRRRAGPVRGRQPRLPTLPQQHQWSGGGGGGRTAAAAAAATGRNAAGYGGCGCWRGAAAAAAAAGPGAAAAAAAARDFAGLRGAGKRGWWGAEQERGRHGRWWGRRRAAAPASGGGSTRGRWQRRRGAGRCEGAAAGH